MLPDSLIDALPEVERSPSGLDRRAFLRRLEASVAHAALHETQMAIAVLLLEGLTDIDQLISTPWLRDWPQGYVGHLSDNQLAVVLEATDREAIEAYAAVIISSLRGPVRVGSADVQVTPFIGVAVRGQDSSSPRALLEQARAAARDARRDRAIRPRFFTDTLQLRSLARLDIAREMRETIATGDISLRYRARHDLNSGALTTWVGYPRWVHPVRGEIRPVEFLRTADSTELGTTLSRAALAALRNDFLTHASGWDPQVRISFGPLRHHILNPDFVDDIVEFLADGAVPAGRLELRIAEKTFIAWRPADLARLQQLGVRVVIDKIGRGMAALEGLAPECIWGVQLDRAWVNAFRRDAAALSACRTGIAQATARGLTAIATGVDDQSTRETVLSLGCSEGTGGIYFAAFPAADPPMRSAASGA
jgi:predicted signal transduction protein with EAL and GGDEF domain